MSVTYSENKANKDLKNSEIANKLESSSNAINQVEGGNNFFLLNNPYQNFNMYNMHQPNPININNKEASKIINKENFSFKKDYKENNNLDSIQNQNSSYYTNSNKNKITNENSFFNNINKIEELNNNNNSNANNLNYVSDHRGIIEKSPKEKSETFTPNISDSSNTNFKNKNNFLDESNQKITNTYFPPCYFPGYQMNYIYPPYPHPFPPNLKGAQNENNCFPFNPPPIQTFLNAYSGNPYLMKQYEEFIKCNNNSYIVSKNKSNNNNENNNYNNFHQNFNLPVYAFPPPNFGYDNAFKPYFQSEKAAGNYFNLNAFDNANNINNIIRSNDNNANENQNRKTTESNNHNISNNVNNSFNKQKACKPLDEKTECLLNTINNYKKINSNESLNSESVENANLKRTIINNNNNNLNYATNKLPYLEMQNILPNLSNENRFSGASSSNDFYINMEMQAGISNRNIIDEIKSGKNFSNASQSQNLINGQHFHNKYLENFKQQIIDNNNNRNNNNINK